ncbi:MAG: PH domain-containing protein [Chitinophagaceae bacterium]|nr:PH domain-containing protein [Chitinophagaceae bacterium]
MKNNQEHNWNIPQRQASAGLLVIVYKALITVIKVIWPLALVVIFRERNKNFDTFEMLLIGVPAIILIRSVIDFFYFRFYIEKDDLIIKRGFLSKKVITIPLRKIQSVHIEQNLVHQFLSVAKLTIDTAGSEKSEAEIDAISIYKAESFKEFLLKNEKIAKDAEQSGSREVEIPLIRLSVRDLFKLGLSANHLQAFFIVLAFGVSMLQNLEEIFGNRVITLIQESSSAIGFSIASVASLIVFVLIISVIVSIVKIVLNYSNFNCSETEQGFRIQTGLINIRQNFVPFSKIQFISWQANWIRCKIGLYMLEFHQAQNEQAKKKQRIRLPITKREYVTRLLEPYHQAVKPVAQSVHGIHKIYPIRRMLVTGLPMALLMAGLAFFWIKEYAVLFLLWLPYAYLINLVYRKKFRFYVSPEAFQVNSGAWGKKSKIAQWYKIQYVELRQSFYQRKKQLATLIIHTAGGKIRVPYIQLDLARAIQNYSLYKIETATKHWM